MRKSNFGSSSSQRHSVLKPRNTDITPTGRRSTGLKNLRTSTEGMTRRSQIRFTPTRSNIPKYTPVRSNVPSSSALLAPPSANRLSVDSTRSSSIGGKKRRDTRPIGETSFRHACMDKILDFLDNNGCTIEVTRKTLQNPISRDFVNIFNFIFGHVKTNYTLPSRFEEEIPRLLKALKYPSPMTKSTFTPIGSRHTWPAVLAMLAWLIDLISFFSPSKEFFLSSSDFDIDSTKKQIRSNKLREIYFSNNDDFGEQYADYEHTLETALEVKLQNIIELQESEEKLEEEIAELDKGPQRLNEMMAMYEGVVSDREKIHFYNNELSKHVSGKDAERAHLKSRLDEVMAILQQLNGEQARLEKEKEKQGFNFEEIAKFKFHAKELSDEIAQIQAKTSSLDSQIWTLQMNIGKAQKEKQDIGHTYNKGVSELGLGEEYEIVLGNVSEVFQDWKKKLWDLKEHKKEVKHAMYESQRQKMRNQETAAMVQESLNDRKSQLKKLESKLRRLEEDISMTKNEIEREENEMETEMERLHISSLESRKEQKTPLHQLQNSLEEVKNDLEATKSNGKARMRAGAEFLLKVCQEAIEDLDKRTKLAVKYKKDVMEYCNRVLESVINSRLAAQEILEKLQS